VTKKGQLTWREECEQPFTLLKPNLVHPLMLL